MSKHVKDQVSTRPSPFKDGLPSIQPPIDNKGSSLDGMLDVDVQMSVIKNFGEWVGQKMGMSEMEADWYGESLITAAMEDSCFMLAEEARDRFAECEIEVADNEILDALNDAMHKAERDAYKSDAIEASSKMRDIAIYLINVARSDYESMGGFGVGVLKLSNYEPGPMKEDIRIDQKAKVEKRGLYGEPRYDDILDYGRSRDNAQTPTEVGLMCTAVEWAYIEDIELPHGARIIDVENRFEIPTPNGHRGLKANIAIPLEDSPRPYHIVEFQVQHEGFEKEIEAKRTAMNNKLGLTSHSGYEQRRYMSDRFKDPNDDVTVGVGVARHYGDVIRICSQIHQDAARKFGLDTIDFDYYFDLRTECYQEQLKKQELVLEDQPELSEWDNSEPDLNIAAGSGFTRRDLE